MQSSYERFSRILADAGETPCQSNPDAFFPEDAENGVMELEQRKIAKKLCNGCPVQAECLAYALDAREEYGIWGGYTLYQRRELQRKWRG